MPTVQSDFLYEAIRETLAQPARVNLDANRVAETALITWQAVAARLSPMIGDGGVDVLLRRSLYLTSNALPWLAIDENRGDAAALLVSLKMRLAARETDDAANASYTLLVTFTELLISLIGESLTERLLGPVWEPLLAYKQENLS